MPNAEMQTPIVGDNSETICSADTNPTTTFIWDETEIVELVVSWRQESLCRPDSDVQAVPRPLCS